MGHGLSGTSVPVCLGMFAWRACNGVCVWCVCLYLYDILERTTVLHRHMYLTQAAICGPPSGHGVQPLSGASVQGV